MRIIIELNDEEKDILLRDVETAVKEKAGSMNLLQKATTVEKDDEKEPVFGSLETYKERELFVKGIRWLKGKYNLKFAELEKLTGYAMAPLFYNPNKVPDYVTPRIQKLLDLYDMELSNVQTVGYMAECQERAGKQQTTEGE